MIANLANLVAESAQRRPDHVALIDADRRTTYAALDSAIDAFCGGLCLDGIGPGDRVALLLGNTTEFVVSYFAILRRGAVAVPLNTGLAPDEIAHAIAEVAPRAIIVEPALQPLAQEAVGDSVALIVTGAAKWSAMLAAGQKQPAPHVKDSAESLAVLLFTAGSTGRPRAAMLTHRALLDNITELLELSDPSAMVPDDIVLGVLPLFHVYSLNTTLGLTMAAGATLVLEQRFAQRQTLERVHELGVTVVGGAPPMYIAWSPEPDLSQMLAGVRLMISGSSPLPPSVFDQFATMAEKPIWEGYGLTECSPVVTTTLVSGLPKAGSVGRPLPGIEVMLVDQGGDPVEDGTGEVYIRGSSLFSGYWPDGAGGPDNNGWYATGDVAVVDDDGDLRLVDRRTELILVSGFNVYPREVERVIAQLPQVAEVAVIGIPHPYSGEAVKAFVSLIPGATLEPADVVTHCLGRLARFKCPTSVEIRPELPHTTVDKVARGALRGSVDA